jgi:hypothetical protein
LTLLPEYLQLVDSWRGDFSILVTSTLREYRLGALKTRYKSIFYSPAPDFIARSWLPLYGLFPVQEFPGFVSLARLLSQ